LAEEGFEMKRVLVVVSLLLLAGAVAIQAQPKQFRFFLSPASTVPSADVLKNLGNKCPNASLTLDSKKSDYMLEAGGWSGHYRFTVFKHGGDAVFSTSTVMLSNAVKDVCHYVNTQNEPPAPKGPPAASH
jgi:hypothetical protein